MAEVVQLTKTVYNKFEFDKVIANNFSTFVETSTTEQETTVDDFFTQYEDLFYEIPIEGDVNSHTYLIQKSSELVNFETATQDIQPLLDEIASLREELLAANQQIIELETRPNG